MKLVPVLDSRLWEAFQTDRPWAQFLQSWAWGEFRMSRGFEVKRFALVDGSGGWLATVSLEFRPKKFVGGYWYAPRGPVFSPHISDADKRAVFLALLDGLRASGLSRALFWRFEPPVELGKPEGFIPPFMRRNDALNPSATIILDLSPSQEALRAAFHQKTRYNIGLAARHGVVARVGTSAADTETFLDLMEETAGRDKFVQHDRAYLRATIEALSKQGMARLRLAEHGGKVLAGNLEMLYGDTVTYLYGASSSASREVMAPYALHWDAITDAKRDGYDRYDFWGANPWSKAMFGYKPSWEGITRFKRGWGAAEVDLYGTWDLPCNMLLYRLAFLRHALRG